MLPNIGKKKKKAEWRLKNTSEK